MAEGFDEIEMGEYEELEDVVQDLRKDVIDMIVELQTWIFMTQMNVYNMYHQ